MATIVQKYREEIFDTERLVRLKVKYSNQISAVSAVAESVAEKIYSKTFVDNILDRLAARKTLFLTSLVSFALLFGVVMFVFSFYANDSVWVNKASDSVNLAENNNNGDTVEGNYVII